MNISKNQDYLLNQYIILLLVEESAEYAQFVRSKLCKSKRAEFQVNWADSLSKGLQELAHNDIDIVLLDLNLPDSQGIDTLIRLQKHASKIPIIIMTAIDDESVAIKSIQMGAQSYLKKDSIEKVNLARTVLRTYRRFNIEINKRDTLSPDSRSDYFRSALDSNADGIVIVNKDGYVQYFNAAAEIIFGRNEEEIIGSHFGLPLANSDQMEVNIIHKNGVNAVMEMRVATVEWVGETAYLASLRDVTDRKNKEDDLYNLSITDDLTGLYNRRGFFSLAERHLNMVSHNSKGFLILFIDLDGLKEINDTLGHLIGSQALVDTAEVLRETFRNFDIIGRFGGDEFVILAKNSSKKDADLIKKRIQINTETFNRNEVRPYDLSMSVGVAHYDPFKPTTIEELVDRADRNMYADKQNKRTRSSKNSH